MLMAQGKSETDEADALRDAMEPHWHGLNEAEMERVRWLSEDLYALEGKEMLTEVSANQRTHAWLASRLQAAQENEEWDTVLALLRYGPEYLSSAEVAYYRGFAYSKLGIQPIALLFYEFAQQQTPFVEDAIMQSMILLFFLNRTPEAIEKANRLIEGQETRPDRLFVAAMTLFQAAHIVPEEVKPELIDRVIFAIEEALKRVPMNKDADILQRFKAQPFVTLGFCYLSQGSYDEATAAFNNALKIEPTNQIALTNLYALTSPNDPRTLKQVFREKIREYASSLPALSLAA